MARRKKRGGNSPPVKQGNLALMENIAAWCRGSIPAIMEMMDWHVQRPSDGGVLGFKAASGGDAKILAVAHLDYHCSGKVNELDEHHIVSSALDDRLGACLAYNLETYIGVKADVVFCDKEETGNSTLPLLGTKMLDKYNWIVELDRRGEGAVFYQYAVMEQYLKKHFEVHHGTFSDICTICHTSPIGAFNMAVGYDLEHTERCNATYGRIARQLIRLKNFYAEFGDTKILHVPPAKTAWQYRTERPTYNNYQPKVKGYQPWDDDWDDSWGDTDKARTGQVVRPSYHAKRNWKADEKGKVIQLPEKAGDGMVDVGKEIIAWGDLTAEERGFLLRNGWTYYVTLQAFIKGTDFQNKLTMDGFLELEDKMQLESTAKELKQQVEDGEMDKEDLDAYALLGWERDPDTGEFYKVGGDE